MGKKSTIVLALALLFAVMAFMLWDLFFNNPDGNSNPYAYDLKLLKTGDTTLIMYTEAQHFNTGIKVVHGIAIDGANRMYVCGENSVEVFDSAGNRVTTFPISGTAHCIAVDENNQIYLGMQDHIEIYQIDGRQIKKWKSVGSQSTITSIAVANNAAYIADAGRKVVYHCDYEGNILKKIGEKDPARTIPGFVIPSPYFDLNIGINGELWVVNPGRHRFEKYNSEGDLTSSWGVASMTMEGFCGCCNPSNFVILSNGSFVTAEKGIERVKVYDPNGNFMWVVAGSDAFIEGTQGIDLARDSKDRIILLDPEKNQIRIFTLTKPKN
jgi:hypothetical protein